MTSVPAASSLVLGLTLALLGCDDSRLQACAPGNNARCAEGETCSVDADGTPRCVEPGAVPEGGLCRVAPVDADAEADAGPGGDGPDADRCADGLGCLRVAGVSRCLRFCDPALADDPCRAENPRVAAGAGTAVLSDFGRCLAVLPDRPEIGICVLPCRPERRPGCIEPGTCANYPDDCPSGTVCGVAPAAPVPLCIPAGPGIVGDPCDANRSCQAGLLCTRLNGASRCRMATDILGGCPPGQQATPLAGVSEPVSELLTVEQVCLPEAG